MDADEVGMVPISAVIDVFLEGCDIGGMPGQDRHQAQDQRQFARSKAPPKSNRCRQRVERFGLGGGIVLAVIGPAVVAQQFPEENSTSSAVTGLPSEKRAPGIEMEGDVTPDVVQVSTDLCQQAVEQ